MIGRLWGIRAQRFMQVCAPAHRGGQAGQLCFSVLGGASQASGTVLQWDPTAQAAASGRR